MKIFPTTYYNYIKMVYATFVICFIRLPNVLF